MRSISLKAASMALLSIILLFTGGMMLYQAFYPNYHLNYQSGILDLPSAAKLTANYDIESLEDFAIRRANARPFHLKVARYRDESGGLRSAIVFLPETEEEGLVLKANTLRNRIWSDATQSILDHVEENAVFFSWWDNAQRLHFLTGQPGWATFPIAEAYTKNDAKNLWREIGGGFDPDPGKLTRFARWLLMDANEGLEKLKKVLLPEQTAYFLTSMDDLARLQEISTVAGRTINIESRVFRSTDNFHNLITQVKNWAKEGGTGSYLVQPLPGVGVRAWRISDKEDENLLLIRLLPFTHSLENPLDDATMVFRSDWSGYLSIFQIVN